MGFRADFTRLILTAAFLSSASLMSSNAFAQKQISSSSLRFNTTLSRPVSSVVLLPAIAFGGSGAASYSTGSELPENVRAETKNAANYEAGLLAEFGQHTFVFQTGLMYKSHGIKVSVDAYDAHDGSNYSATSETTLKYLSLPLMGKARVRIGEGVRLAARAGAELAFLMGGTSTMQMKSTDAFGHQTASTSTSGDVEPKGNNRPVNFYLTAGIGPEFRIARNQNIRLEGFYERMMLPVQMHTPVEFTIHAWNAMLSYAVGF